MGGLGSGPSKVPSRAYDSTDLTDEIIAFLYRHLAGDPERELTLEKVDEWKVASERVKKLITQAVERERQR